MGFRGKNLLLVALAGASLVSCSDDGQAAPGNEKVNAGLANAAPTTQAPPRQASADEQARFELMLTAAMNDGEFSAGDLTMFALESVHCAKRAGFDAVLVSIEPENRTSIFSVTALDKFDETADLAMEACLATFFEPAQSLYDQSNPVNPEEVRLEQQRQDLAILTCLEEAGFDFQNAFDGLTSDLVPDDVSHNCMIASFERP